jgi:UDPglucose 6-dehydrogenase
VSVAERNGVSPRILEAVDEVNDAQKEVLFQKLNDYFKGKLANHTVAIWGLAFKPRTDDIREAPALVLIDRLLDAGARIRVHDPVAMENVRKKYGDKLTYCATPYATLDGADALAILTEWNEFRNPDFSIIRKKLSAPVIFDGRNLFDPQKMDQLGIQYSGIGLESASPKTAK